MLRRTKIIATLGPATDRDGELDRMVEAGLDVARINFSHGTIEDHRARVDAIRAAADRHKHAVGIMADLQGPKIRVDRFEDGKIMLDVGAPFTIDGDINPDDGNQTQVGCSYKELPRDLKVDDVLMLDDGNIILKVESIRGSAINTIVQVGGELSNNKGVNKRGGGLTAATLTEKDHADIKTAAELGVDYVAVSFVRNAVDMHVARELTHAAGGQHIHLVSKVERAEAIENMEEVIDASDVVMIARGDLGIEIGNAELPAVQKRLIAETRKRNAIAITATQMMQSMVEASQPTRAEVLDVANAVLDGTDCVMLSAESAVGNHPSLVIESLDRICRGAERHPEVMVSSHRLEQHFDNSEEATAMAAMYTANHFDVAAIVALTESGSTTKWMSRINSELPIYAVTRHQRTHRRVAMYRGVYPISFNPDVDGPVSIERQVMSELRRIGSINPGEKVILTKGDLDGVAGGTNTMKVLTCE